MMMNQNVCRCCLLENPTLTSNIFENNLRSELLECVPKLNIELEDGLPDVICDACVKQMQKVLEFRQRCILTDIELRKRYEETNRAIDEALAAGALLDVMQVNALLMTDVDADVDIEEELDLLQQKQSENDQLLNFDVSSTMFNNLLSDDCCLTELLQAEANDCRDTVPASVCSAQPKPKKKSQRSAISKSQHACTECSKKFTRNFQLKLHLISVHNIGDGLQYICESCNKTFASRHSLSYHQKSMHSGERPFSCHICLRSFVLRTQLSSHMRTHTGESKPRIYQCSQCQKCWPTKSDLRTHMRSHDPSLQRPFKCDQCEKSFFTRGHLLSHHLVHTGEKPFACIYCEKCYQSVGNLNNHMIRVHSDLLYRDLNQAASQAEL